MRRFVGVLGAIALSVFASSAWCQQKSGDPAGQPSQSTTQAPASSDTSLADAARKAREQKKSSKPTRVYTNEDLPTSGGISSATASTGAAAPAGTPTHASSGNDDQAWREKFGKLHEKLDRDKRNLDVMMRELSVLNVQYYDDPVKAMQQQYSREDINKKTADIDKQKKAIEEDQQAISDAEEALRKAGGDAALAR